MSLTTIALTDRQLDAIVASLECYVEGYEDATNDVIKDPSLETPEMLCEAVTGMHDDFDSAVGALVVLRQARKELVG